MSVVLSEHLPMLATAPDGIQKLRGLILELAVRGKLVPQDPNDEPASELLKRIAQERARLSGATVRKKNEQTPLSEPCEWPFELPSGWEWEQFGEIAEIERGGSPRPIKSFLTADPDGLNWIKIGDTDKGGKYITSTSEKIRRDGLTKTRMVYPGDFLLTNSMSFGRPYITQIEGCIHDGWLRISRPNSLDKDYLYTLLSSPFVRKLFVIAAAGAVVMNLNADKVRELPIPLPPLAEQHRIVAKVDELMALCDRLEAEQADTEMAHAKLVDTLLGTLTQSTDAADLAANWQRLAEHFDTLFTTESCLDALKQTILQLAVMGKLHEDASGGWETKRLDKVCSEIVDCPHSTPKWTTSGKICVRTSQFKPGRLDLSECRFVSESTFAERIARLKPAADDVLYSREGGILGVACRVPPEAEICLGQRMMLLRPGSQIASAFLELVLNSPMITKIARQNTTGGAAPRVNVSTVRAYPIPTPPLTEQHCVIAKVNELMALCDHLKADLAESQIHQERVARTLIESTLQAA